MTVLINFNPDIQERYFTILFSLLVQIPSLIGFLAKEKINIPTINCTCHFFGNPEHSCCNSLNFHGKKMLNEENAFLDAIPNNFFLTHTTLLSTLEGSNQSPLYESAIDFKIFPGIIYFSKYVLL